MQCNCGILSLTFSLEKDLYFLSRKVRGLICVVIQIVRVYKVLISMDLWEESLQTQRNYSWSLTYSILACLTKWPEQAIDLGLVEISERS